MYEYMDRERVTTIRNVPFRMENLRKMAEEAADGKLAVVTYNMPVRPSRRATGEPRPSQTLHEFLAIVDQDRGRHPTSNLIKGTYGPTL